MTQLALLLSHRLRTCHVGSAHAISRREWQQYRDPDDKEVPF